MWLHSILSMVDLISSHMLRSVTYFVLWSRSVRHSSKDEIINTKDDFILLIPHIDSSKPGKTESKMYWCMSHIYTTGTNGVENQQYCVLQQVLGSKQVGNITQTSNLSKTKRWYVWTIMIMLYCSCEAYNDRSVLRVLAWSAEDFSFLYTGKRGFYSCLTVQTSHASILVLGQ